MADAIVVGAGQNGLVAANLLADAGWDVLVVEAEGEPGGAVRTGELTGRPGFRHDLFSSFYPLAAGSPAIRALDLEAHGLRWRRGPLVVAHPASDGTCAVLSQDLEETVASLDAFAPGDGEAWRRLYALWQRVAEPLLDGLATPMPPILPGLRIAAALRRDLARFLRLLVLPVRRLAEEEFRGGGARLLAGHAVHADLAPEMPLSSVFAWVLASLGQQHGFPTPEGGAGELVRALVRRLEASGGTLLCDARVEGILVRRRRAVGVRLADGRQLEARRAVIADVAAPILYHELVGREHLPARLLEDLRRFQYDFATFKVDWALDRPIPWEAEPARRSGVVHVSEDIDELTLAFAQLAMGLIPARPPLVMGQYSMVDPSRSPAGTDTAWAYTHLPQEIRGDAGGDLTGTWDDRETDALAERIEARVEALAPGFRESIRARHVFTPPGFERANANLVRGAMQAGTAQLHQQAIFRPTPGLGRPETPVRRLYLASGSVHPGGGVHGGGGANAARAALAWSGRSRSWK